MQVVVVGAGYAGTIAANRLARKVPDARITVVNPRPDFVERVRLHEHLAGSGTAAIPLSSMLREGIATRIGTVAKVGDGSVTLDDGTGLDFDHLFLAVGSTAVPLPGTVPVGAWEGAEQARGALAGLAAGSVVTVVGGGLTGAETASEIAEARPDLRVRLVGEGIVPTLSPGARDRVRAALRRLTVEIVEDTVTEAPAGAVRLRSGGELPSDLSLWAITADIPGLARRSGLDVNAEGRAIVDEYLRSVSDPRVFVVGDCAAVPGARLACATAAPQGAHAADTLARMVDGRGPRPFSMGYVGQAVSLGRRDGLLQVVRRDDSMRRLYVAGRVAAVTKARVVAYARYGSRTARYAWLPGPK
ncbi:NAD(P)/FAD-dependent oxidoreductase [Actinomadura macrotermitis]|uniref:NADH dehydrogenase-like protein YjlD n=1 Tax=Actinomadura macrotermitis TaxID=2585200 RepID=A0A7K0C422_9ACTN|nr:FAD-dependent oxidoreductase [Actinomadura macrotermitis]MQY08200.1 NADH dehydrogenase-like protein YjlD [Actinomadura macrotermitis]